MAHKSCKGSFFKESYLQSQRTTLENSLDETENEAPTSDSNETCLRKSSRKSLQYQSTQVERKCIICNEDRFIKGRLVPLQNVSLARDGRYKAEETLKEFASIHLQNNNKKYVDGANRILLTLNTASLFAANVSYHKSLCYDPFRSPWWKKKEKETKSQCIQNDNQVEPINELYNLVSYHIINKHEIYTLAQLTQFYEQLVDGDETCPTLRSIDLKDRLREKFAEKLKFSRPTQSWRITSEFVMSSDENLISDCLTTAMLGGGIQKCFSIKNMSSSIREEIQDGNKRRQQHWPPTPQEVMQPRNLNESNSLYNLLAWIVSPHSSRDEQGVVKLSCTKATKVTKICEDIESLVPNASPALSQVLLSLNMYRKTGSSIVVDDLHKLGHGLSYTETTFVEDKWAEWTESESNIVPSNIEKNVIVTHVVDNIDWKNKNLRGKETHNTNSILIQQTKLNCEKQSILLNPNYNFDRRLHKAFKGFKAQLPQVKFVRAKCKKLKYQEDKDRAEYLKSSNINLIWSLARFVASLDTQQSIPSWSGFHQLVNPNPNSKANVGYLQPITTPPTEMKVIFAVINRSLDILKELNLQQMFLEVDQAIYTKVLDAMFRIEANGDQIFDKIVPRMGGFHILICMLRTIYSRFKDSGIIQWLLYSGIGGEGTITSALKGGNVKLAIHLHKLMYEAIMRTKFRYSGGVISEEMTLQLNDFGQEVNHKNLCQLLQNIHPFARSSGDMVFWLDLYLDMVDLLFNMIYFQRCGNWKGFLQTIAEFLPFCFSLNRHNYARNLSYYYIQMLNLPESHPDLYRYLQEEGFTTSISGFPHSRIPCDQIIEMTINRSSKDTGGLSGKTENIGASERWMRINHIMAALREHLDDIVRRRKLTKHIDFGEKRMLDDERDVQMLVTCLEEWVPGLWEPEQPLVNIATGTKADINMVENVKTMKCRGEEAMNEFVSRFTIKDNNPSTSSASYYNKIKRQKVLSFENNTEKVKNVTISEDENKSFGEILSCFEGKKLNLRFIMKWPVTTKPYAICAEDGKVRSNPKHLFRNKLQLLSPQPPFTKPPSDISVSIVDAMRVVRIIPIKDVNPPTFLSWAKAVFSYIEGLPGDTVHVVFDNYATTDDSTIPLSKGRASTGVERKISNLNQVLPKLNEWQSFLSNSKNKFQLCCLLADFFTSNEIVTKKNVFVTKERGCFMKPLGESRLEIPTLFSMHKEADHRLAFNAKYASNTSATVCVVADDTDVYILLLYIALQCQGTLYFRQGTHSSTLGITYHNVTALAQHFGDDICKTLPPFHALTGSDYTKTFYRRSKIQSFKKILSQPLYGNLLLSLQTEQPNIPEVTDFIIHVIYNRPKKEKTPGESRYAMLFVGKGNKRKFASTKSLVPDEKSLHMKILRANFVSHSWINCLNPNYKALDPLQNGWKLENNVLQPVWYHGPALPSEDELNNESDKELDSISTEDTGRESSDNTVDTDDNDDDDDDDDDDSVSISDAEAHDNDDYE